MNSNSKLYKLDRESQNILSEVLSEGETVKWEGVPRVVILPPRLIFFPIFGLLLIIFGIGIYSQSNSANISNKGNNFTIMIICAAGIMIAIGPIIANIMANNKIRYYVTTKRAIIIELGRKKCVSSFWPEDLQNCRLENAGEGLMNLIFKEKIVGRDQECELIRNKIGFKRIENGKTVAGLIEKLGRMKSEMNLRANQ